MRSTNETLRIISERHSVRSGFKPQDISPDHLSDILHAGLSAPSSKNAQPWQLHVVRRGDKLNKIASLVDAGKHKENVPIDPSTGLPRQWESTVSASAKVLQAANVGIFIENRGPFSGGRDNLANSPAEHRKDAILGYTFEAIGIGAMIQNMWLAGRTHGIEGVFMGDPVGASGEDIKSELSMQGDLIGALALGYADIDAHQHVARELNTDLITIHTT